MATYKIIGSYKVYEVDANPDVVVGQAPGNNSYAFSVSTAEDLKALVIANAQALVDAATTDKALKEAVLDSIDG